VLNQQQLDQFDRDGFLIIDDVIDSATLTGLRDEYHELANSVASAGGHSDRDWSRLDFESKLTHLIATDPAAYELLDISLPLRDGLTEKTGIHTGPAVFNLLTHARLLDIVESVIGPEIYSNPVQHVRIKPPERMLNDVGRGSSNMARTGWHQDAAVIVKEADTAPILTVWVAITDAKPEMGCMQAVAGSHLWTKLGKHCPGHSGVGEIFIPSDLVRQHKPVHLEVAAGGVVLLNKKTWHGAGPNLSDRIRWSFDLRYQPPGFPTGRDCFPGFLARSARTPEQVLHGADNWAELWITARSEIASGKRKAVFNERWVQNRYDPLCA